MQLLDPAHPVVSEKLRRRQRLAERRDLGGVGGVDLGGLLIEEYPCRVVDPVLLVVLEERLNRIDEVVFESEQAVDFAEESVEIPVVAAALHSRTNGFTGFVHEIGERIRSRNPAFQLRCLVNE